MSNASGDDTGTPSELPEAEKLVVRGDDEELKELVESVRDALRVADDTKALNSLREIESLFGRIRED